MTATLRHFVGRDVIDLLEIEAPTVRVLIDVEDVSVHQGYMKRPRQCYAFSLRLPRDYAAAWSLLRACEEAADLGGAGGRGCCTLARNLRLALGVDTLPADSPFLAAIDEAPGDLANWSALADWLQDSQPGNERGETIAAVLGRKAVKVKYGIPASLWWRRVKEGRP